MIKIKFKNWDKYNKRQKDIKRPYWFAMSNDIFFDAFYIDLSEQERQSFIWLLCEASRQNKYGELEVSEKQFSQVTGYKISVLSAIVDKLLKSGRAAGSRQDGGIIATATEHNITEHNKEYMCDSNESHHANDFAFEEIYKIYPKRLGATNKGKGIAKLKRIIKTPEDFQAAMNAVKAYADWCKQTGKVKTELVKMFSSFFDANNDWREWITFKSEDKKNRYAFLEKMEGLNK